MIGLIVAIAISIVEPFGLDDAIGAQGRLFFYKVAGFAYPEDRSPKTLVVLADQTYLNATESGKLPRSWPLSFDDQTTILDAILVRHPRALFIDLAFVDPREDAGLDTFKAHLAAASRTTRIYIPKSPEVPVRREIEDLVRDYPAIQFVSVAAGSNLGHGFAYRAEPERGGLRPAAMKIYEDLQACGRICHPDRAGEEMDIWWAAPRKDRFNCDRPTGYEGCAQLRQNWVERLLSLTLRSFGELVPKAWRAVDPITAPYAPTVSAAELLDPALHKKIAPMLHDAVVFYGVNLPFLGDVDESTVQGAIPAIQAHAMAYDNLVALGGHYVTTKPPFGLGAKAHAVVCLTILSLAALTARLLVTVLRPTSRLQPHLRDKLFGGLDAAVFSGVVILLAVVEFVVFRVGPAIWAPILLAAFASDFLATRPLLGPVIVGWLGRKGWTDGRPKRPRTRSRR